MLSYTASAVTVEDANDYADARAWPDWAGDDQAKTAALRRGQDFIAGSYNGRWSEDTWTDADAPDRVKFAIIEAARRELASPGSLSPDLERGGAIKELDAGSVKVIYADGASAVTVFTAIDNLLSPLIARLSGGATVDLLRV